MDFEKIVNSKLYDWFEIIYRILVLNLINIFCLVLVIPFLTSVTASFEVVKNLKNREYKFFKNYFISFKKSFSDTFAHSILFILIFIVIALSIKYYYEMNSDELIYQFAYLFMILMFVLLFQMFVYMPIILKDFYFFNNLQKIKFAFYFSLRNILWTILYDIIFILILLTILYVPLIFFMGELTLFIIIINRTSYKKLNVIKEIYEKVIKEEENEIGD